MVEWAFLLKKVIGRLLCPIGLVLIFWVVGLGLLRLRPNSRWGTRLIFVAIILLFAFMIPAFSYILLSPLEKAAGPYADPGALNANGVDKIVVLGAAVRQGVLTTADRVSGDSLLRTVEGVRLWKGMPGSKLIFAGGDLQHKVTVARAMYNLAMELGVPKEALVLEELSWDTEDSARVLASQLGNTPFALVTSASHMRRALAIFRAYDLHPLGAPTGFRTQKFKFSLESMIPNTISLTETDTAFYEYWGWMWVNIKLWFNHPKRSR